MGPIKFLLLVFMIMLAIGLFAHVQTIPALLSVSGRDSWITIIVTVLPMILWLFILGKLVKLSGKISVTDWKENLSPFRYYLLVGPFVLYLIFSAFITSKDIVIWSHISYIPDIKYEIIVIVFLFICYLGTKSGTQSLAILSGILLPLVVVLGIFVMTVNVKNKQYELLFPIFEDGYMPILNGLIYTMLPLVELFIIMIIPHVDNKTMTTKKIFLIGGIIVGLMLGPTIGAITEFGPDQASIYRYPAFEQWRILTIGNYFSHVDFFAIYQWLAGGVLRTSLYVLIASYLLTRKKQKKYTVISIYLVLMIGCFYRIDQHTFYEFVYTFFMPASLLVLTIQLAILFVFLTLQNHKKKLEKVKQDG
ncbi:hypothetical protein WQ54_06065 [Bacillus sp. SA1-12]|uniref:endospore germination permease n=1 Tax=Bacillus sp. SA1-12 TaxID=1455638 RepID=UPI0006256EC8|nr:endospore germination permease [Bacillus sp. SA1-12]KKI93069.1 hypothetical protein WQ54_06065 [Bacillus sp. SA1-12]